MMKSIKKNLYLYCKIQFVNIKSLAQYREDFIIMMISTTLSQICNLALIGVIYANVPTIAGWNVWEILLLYSFLLFSEGSVNLFSQGAWKITRMINKAEIDVFLTRPLPIALQMITSKIDFDGINKMILSIAIFCYGAYHCDIDWSIAKLFYLLIVLIAACMIRFCMIWIASCSSFWLEGNKNNLNFLVLSLGEMAKYPLTIYPLLMNICFSIIIPYAFVSYIPIAFLLEKSQNYKLILLIPIICILMLLISNYILKLGLKRYDSNGN